MDNLVEHASLDVLEAAIKKKRKLLGVPDPVKEKPAQLPVQTHEIWDIKRQAIGLTDRQCLKSAKFDRLDSFGEQNIFINLSRSKETIFTTLRHWEPTKYLN